MKNQHTTQFLLFVVMAILFLGSSDTLVQAKKANLKCPIPGGKKYAPYPGSYCVDYYSCDGPNGSAVTLSCPGGWMFNSKTQQCAYIKNRERSSPFFSVSSR
ncbi:hypothetical protein BDA99DRAFT_497435 [Phascolomyces articulosus]|uniref:Chitin-binding type-2 domain-containing protein n=1 Tax=Phascolomyces articulosus TaxID=60185 RepID=A0AAD5KKS7_9FUNG|nr:hypothetical protein BDA99DRAFT_497435 [Phascolomyces articulosus]